MSSYQFEVTGGMSEVQYVMKMFRCGFKTIGNIKVENVVDHGKGRDGSPGCGDIEYLLAGGFSVMIKPSGTEPEIEVSISVPGNSPGAESAEKRICSDIESIINIDCRAGYCCE